MVSSMPGSLLLVDPSSCADHVSWLPTLWGLGELSGLSKSEVLSILF